MKEIIANAINRVDSRKLKTEGLYAIGERIRSKRRALNLTQNDLSDFFSAYEKGGGNSRCAAGMSRVSISNWERGLKTPTTWDLILLCELFGCSLDELMLGRCHRDDGDELDQLVPFYCFVFLILSNQSIKS